VLGPGFHGYSQPGESQAEVLTVDVYRLFFALPPLAFCASFVSTIGTNVEPVLSLDLFVLESILDGTDSMASSTLHPHT
jgi:hypothetical protein